MNIKRIIREEMDGLQWIKDVKVNPWDGIEFKVSAHKTLKTTYKILDWGDPEGVRVVWRDNDDYRNEWKYNHYTREEVEKYFNKGKWVMVEKSGHHYDFNENITEGEDDLEWIKGNPIDVGKCFIINDFYRSLNAVVTIKEMEQREWKNNIYQKGGEFNPDDIMIHLVGVTQEDKEDVGPNFRITYNELVEDINDGNLVPTDCGNNINESDGLEWISDVKTNQDIAQEIADESEIKDNKLFFPFLTSPFPLQPLLLQLPHPSFPFSFKKYCKEQYGLNDDDIKDVWNRYKNIIIDKINNHNLNESDDMEWIRDTVNDKLIKNENWILVNDIDRESIAEGHEIQKYLFGLGYDWGQVPFDLVEDLCIYTIYHYGALRDNCDQIYFHDGCRDAEVRISDRDIKSGEYMVYYWSDLKPKKITESDDSLQWIKDANPHLPKDDEDLKNFIGWSFIWDPSHEKSGKWGYQGKSWEIVEISEKDGFPFIKWENKEFNESNSDTTYQFLKRINEGEWVLISPEGVIFDPLYNREWNGYQGPRITESDELDWIRNTTPNKWDYFEELIKDEPEINIEKNEDGEWVDFRDNKKRPYFGTDLYIDYELEEDIKSNPLPDFLNAVSQHIEEIFQGYDYEEDEDYWDFLTLKEVLEKANEITQ